MKIMTMHYTIKRGGAYDRFRMMLEAMLERQCEIHCLSLTPISIEHPLYYNHVVAFPFRKKDGLMAKLATLLLFPAYGLLMGWRKKVDLFIAFGPLYAFLEAVPKWILRKPMVTFIRLDLSLTSQVRHRLRMFLFPNKMMEYVGLLFSDRIIAVNTTIREEVRKVMERRKGADVCVLFNDIPVIEKPALGDPLVTRAQFGIPDGAKLIVTAGVLTPRKNFEIILLSLSRLAQKDLFLVIVGDASDREGLRYRASLFEWVNEHGLDRQVIFPGWVGQEELWKLLGTADLFVLPSVKEGMPNIILEALGLDLPCFGSRIPGIRDILLHEELLFDPKDEKALAANIDRYFSDDQHSHYLMELCRERKEKFTFDWKENVFQLVTQTIASFGAPR